uniref:G-protein coupled receptors family 3 profile domain-containing protein n=1 Tax=Leptobrachium leishanense TaxID=445787 RepID=A0A8C5MQ02_9ANUR
WWCIEPKMLELCRCPNISGPDCTYPSETIEISPWHLGVWDIIILVTDKIIHAGHQDAAQHPNKTEPYVNSLYFTHRFRYKKFLQFHVTKFAVDEINRNPSVLPNVTLGFQVFDSCVGIHQELDGTLKMLTGLRTGNLITFFYLQISYFSTSSLLSDKIQFPSFFRTVPSDAFQSKGLAQLMLHFGWTWVGIVAVDDDYGRQGVPAIKQELIKGGACVAFTEYIMSNNLKHISYVTKIIKQSTAKAIISFTQDVDNVSLLDEMLRQNVMGRIFVGGEAWSTSSALAVAKYSSLLSGTIGFSFHSTLITGFSEFLKTIHPLNTKVDPWTKTFWELAFGCKFVDQMNPLDIRDNSTLCTGNENMASVMNGYYDVSRTSSAYNIYNAVSIVAKSLHDMQTCQKDQGPFNNGSCADFTDFKPWQVRISAWQRQYISNGTDSLDCIKCPWDTWPNSKKDRCHPKQREFLSFEEPLGAALSATSVFSSSIPLSIFGLFICYKKTPIVRANNFSLSCLLLISMSLCFLSSLAFVGYPQPEKCLLRQVAFGTVFTLCVSCILAKTFVVVFAFMATKPGSNFKKWARPQISYMIVALASFLQLVLCISWISLAPPFPEDNIQTKPGIIIVECNEGSPKAFWIMLGYLGLLATISFIVAFLARRLPDSFNEAKFITFSMLAFLSVWVSYIPASLSSSGKYTVAMEVFAILSSSWALVLCMFAPKCFIILFRPDMNSRKHLMGKT